MERLYKGFLVLMIILAISWGVWYCYSCYEKQDIMREGTLVEQEKLYFDRKDI